MTDEVDEAQDPELTGPPRVSEEGRSSAEGRISGEDLAGVEAAFHDESLPLRSVLRFGGNKLLLLCVAACVAILFGEAREAYVGSKLRAGLDAWQAALEDAGLPAPGVSGAEVPRPSGLEGASDVDFAAEFERKLALEAWNDLLVRDRISGQMPVKKGVGAAMWVCAGLRAPKPDVVALRGILTRVPGGLRETLEVGCDLAEGQNRRAAQRANGLLRQPPRGCRRALESFRDQATRRRVAEVLDQRPPSAPQLKDLLDDARRGDVSAALLGPALEARGASLVELVSEGNPEIERGETVLSLVVTTFPDGLVEGSNVAAGWPALRDELRSLIGERLVRWDLDPAPALAIVALSGRLESSTEMAPRRPFSDWRKALNEVVDDPDRLLRYAQRFLEIGWLPPGVEDLLVTHLLDRDHPVAVGEATPGAILVGSILRVGEIAAGRVEDPLAAAEELLAKEGLLDALLVQRKDPAAQRIRAWLVRLTGSAFLGAKAFERAVELLERAASMGYEPRFRLLHDQARAALGSQATTPRALELIRERVQVLEKHAAVARGLRDPGAVVALELRGYPLQPALLDPIRCEAHLELAAALLAGGEAAKAGEACARAAQLDSRNPRNLLLEARVLQAQGKLGAARKAVFKGLRAVREETIRKQFRALLQELGPN